MRITVQLHWFVWIVFLGACLAKPTSAPADPSPAPPTAYTIVTDLSTNILPTPSLIPASVPTATPVTQPDIENIEWAIYRFEAGVTFEHPSEWKIITQTKDFVRFSGWEDYVSVAVYDRPVEDRAVADPHTWGTSEGGYEVLWGKPISIENADGLEFIWGQPGDNKMAGFLKAIYYSELYELDVRLSTETENHTLDSDMFSVFEYMVRSIRMAQ